MYLLYIDESGNAFDPADRHFVMAGIAVFERRTYWMQREAELIKARNFPNAPPLDFHAQPIRSGHGFWRRVQPEVRDSVLTELGKIIVNAPSPEAVLFGAVIEKTATAHGADAIRLALEQICKRFDTLLARKAKRGNPQRGLIVLAQSQYEQRAKTWVNEQLADYVAHALFLLYERRDPSLIRAIADRFDCTGGVVHGLVHLSEGRGAGCGCPACCARHKPGSKSMWLSPSAKPSA